MSMMMSAHHRIRKSLDEKKKAEAALGITETKEAGQVVDFEKMTAVELKDYAKANSINISGVTKKEDIKARIIESFNTKSHSEDCDPPLEESVPLSEENIPLSDGSVPPSEERTDDNGSNGGTV